jgi:hypothetical protein
MRELWKDDGRGQISIRTDKMGVILRSKAIKNYRNVHSNWSLFFYLNRMPYRVYATFGDTYEGAIQRAEKMLQSMYYATQEII